MPTDILTLLEQLQDLYTRQDDLRAAKAAAVPPALRKLLAKIEARFGPQLALLEREAEHLVADIKAAVVQHGASVKGKTLQAVYLRGKPSWDDRALQGYAAAGHEELLAFRRTGTPSVSVRKAAWSDDAP